MWDAQAIRRNHSPWLAKQHNVMIGATLIMIVRVWRRHMQCQRKSWRIA